MAPAGPGLRRAGPVTRGQVILFVFDPLFRGYFEGSGRLLLNAVFLGPGLGTSQPLPW